MMAENRATDHSPIEIRDEGGNRHEDELLASLIGQKLGQLPPPPPVPNCIFRIPSLLRKHAAEENFVPSIVSIGPLHFGGKKLQAMEDTKLLYLQGLVDRMPTPETSLHNLIKEIRSLEQDCRDCYNEKFHHLSSDKFVEILVVDGCFVIELFRKFSGEVLTHEGDHISYSWMRTAIITDLLLLENQLPWSVLNCLFYLTYKAGQLLLPELALNYFKGHSLGTNPHANAAIENKHLLDFLGNCVLRRHGPVIGSGVLSRRPSIPSVTKLRQYGILIKQGNSNQLLNVTFSPRHLILRIPRLRVGKNGESLFRNLIAYEQCVPSTKSKMISYAVLLDDLIKCENGLQVLIEEGVIENLVGDDIGWFLQSSLFNSVGVDERVLHNFSYDELYEELNAYCRRASTKWMMHVRNDYFREPWAFVNLVIVIFLVTTLTLIQTLYTVLSYYKPES